MKSETLRGYEEARYIVWVDNGDRGFNPIPCRTWDEVISEIRNNYGDWIITRPVKITEPPDPEIQLHFAE